VGDITIRIRGAAQHNLCGIDLDLPKNRLIVFTGISGSGKSSLAFDTLFAEGQRLYTESLSTYARQFLQELPRPQVDSIAGLAPAVAIDQTKPRHNPRSTVATITEIYDHLRVLFAAIGTPHCPRCGRKVGAQSRESVIQRILGLAREGTVQILAPLEHGRKGQFKELFTDLRQKGYARVRVDGQFIHLSDPPELDRYRRHDIEVVVDRLADRVHSPARVGEAVDIAFDLGKGNLIIVPENGKDILLSHNFACPECQISIPEPTHTSFSFNSPRGMCPTCEGLGEVRTIDPELLVTHPEKSLEDGAIPLLGSLRNARRRHWYQGVADHYGFSLDTPWNKLTERQRHALLYGSKGQLIEFYYRHPRHGWEWRHADVWEGIIPRLMRRYKQAQSRQLRQRFEEVIRQQPCPDCHGQRLRPESLAVTIGGKSIADITHLTVDQASEFFAQLTLSETDALIAEDALKEITQRLSFLQEVGLHYLTLDRTAPTLSSGEAQRIRLAGQVGSGLTDCLYILDEPSIGLHYRDQGRMLKALKRLRDLDNTVIIAEHDEQTIVNADYIVDFGPGAGAQGGQIVAAGTLTEIKNNSDSLTGDYLAGRRSIPIPSQRRNGNGASLMLYGARHNNLKNIDVKFPLGRLICITGVSGSGKSSLIADTLYPILAAELHNAETEPGEFDRLEGIENVRKVVMIDQSPIGRTPRSCPATYTNVFDHIRRLYAQLPASRERGYKPGRFSFNVKEGRCPHCEGYGAIKLESDFLADVWVQCEDCHGQRFDRETMSIRYKGASIAEVLDMEVSRALAHFANVPKIKRVLQVLADVGLGYIKLGQPATTLSGGEAQRVKLARELSRPQQGDCLYLLDEPTTGLHFEDIRHLLTLLERIVDAGNTVIIIEHHPDIIKTADYIIDLGPEGGEQGGEVVATGTPEQVAKCRQSYTGQLLNQILNGTDGKQPAPRVGTQRRSSRPKCEAIQVWGAREHNLKNIEAKVPRRQMVVFSGVSGSGKTSLAIDTIYAEGQRRFVESLSSYARQFVSEMPKPKVDRIQGLSPAVVIDPRNTVQTPRSTVGTMTEIYDYLRVLYARLGVPHCPKCSSNLGAASVDDITDRLLSKLHRREIMILAPLQLKAGEEYRELLERLQRQGWVRIRLDGEIQHLPLATIPDRRSQHTLELVVDRLRVAQKYRSRLAEAVETALAVGGGRVIAIPTAETATPDEEQTFSSELSCPNCGTAYPELEPRNYSFNHAQGWCPVCQGLGTQPGVEVAALVPNESKSIREGAVSLWGPLHEGSLLEKLLTAVADAAGFSLEQPFGELTLAQRNLIFYGTNERIPVEGMTIRFKGLVEGIHSAARLGEPMRRRFARAWTDVPCPACGGGRLRPESAATRFRGRTLPALCRYSLKEALDFFEQLDLSPTERQRAGEIPHEILSRLRLLVDLGLDYLTLDRPAASLSGGEAQRIKLAGQLRSGLTGVLYVLDEPTVGVHPRDNERMLAALQSLRDLGNSLIVVEHDPQTINQADYVLDFGPGAGRAGGRIIATGTPRSIKRRNSPTGRYLAGKLAVPIPQPRRWPNDSHGKELKILGAAHHNLKNIDVTIPLGCLVCVTGPSGSGKSSLIEEILYPELAWRLQGKATTPGRHRDIIGSEAVDGVINIDQSPIGQSPRSNAATYTGIFDLIREFYASLPEARMRGYTPGWFSFNNAGGRCERCQGMGAIHVEMHFLPDVWVTCEECQGRRYKPEILEIEYKHRNISDILETTAAEALELFTDFPQLHRVLSVMSQVGLGYLPLGQAAPTLSGGEAQRVKLVRELARPCRRHTIYLLDEPTTGLHPADIIKLLQVLNRLVEQGNTVVVIEHNLDVIKTADYVIDLGPGGGDSGGHVCAAGSPEQVAQSDSPTAIYLKQALATSPRVNRKELTAPMVAIKATSRMATMREQVKAPWQRDPLKWHLEQRTTSDSQQRIWDTQALSVLQETITQLPDPPDGDWEHPQYIKYQLAGASDWFLRARTDKKWYLDLQLRTEKGLFDEVQLAQRLALPTWNEIKDLPKYGEGARVRVHTRAADYDRISLQIFSADDLRQPEFSRFLQACYEGYRRMVGVEEDS